MSGDVRDSLKEALREKIKQSSQAQVAEQLGLDQSTLSRILSGQTGMGGKTLVRVMQNYPDLAALFFASVMQPRIDKSQNA